MSHITHACISHVTHINPSCHTDWFWAEISRFPFSSQSGDSCEWVMSHIWMIHVTRMNESHHITHIKKLRHAYAWVLSHVWMSHVTRIKELWHAYEWVASRVWMSMDEYEWVWTNEHEWASHTYECVVSHVWMRHVAHMRHVTHMNESGLTNLFRDGDRESAVFLRDDFCGSTAVKHLQP